MTDQALREQELRNMELTNAYYGCAADGFNWDAVAGMLSDDFFVTEASDLPIAGTYRGVQGVAALYQKLLVDMIDVTHYEVEQMMAGGEWVVSLLKIYVREEDGSELCMPIAESLRWRDGKLCEMKPYWFDSNHLHRAVALKNKARAAS